MVGLYLLGQWLSTGADLTFTGYLAKFGDRFLCRSSWEVGGGSATGVYWVEARDAAKHPTMCSADLLCALTPPPPKKRIFI